jgi:hypothetical protein
MPPAALDPIVAALRSAGFQANPMAPPPTASRIVIGTVQTGVGGFTVIVTAFRCPNDSSDKICSIGVLSSFSDTQHRVDNDFVVRANARTGFSRVAASHGPDGQPTFTVSSVQFWRDIDYSTTLAKFLPVFGGDISAVLALYNANPG